MMKPNVKTLKFLSADLWCCLSEAKLYREKCFLHAAQRQICHFPSSRYFKMNSKLFQSIPELKEKKPLRWEKKKKKSKFRSCVFIFSILCSGHLSDKNNCVNEDRNTVALQVTSTRKG